MNDETEYSISKAQKDILSHAVALVFKMFFNKLTLNELIMRTNVRGEIRQFNLNYHPAAAKNSVINQNPNERPYFFIHRSCLVSSLVDNMLSRQKKEKEASNIFNIEVEIEGKSEKAEVIFDVSSLWVKVYCEKLDNLWDQMLKIKGLEGNIAA